MWVFLGITEAALTLNSWKVHKTYTFPHSSVGKESSCSVGDPSLIPGEKIPRRRDRLPSPVFLGFPGGSAGKESACNAGDLGSIPGLGRSPGEGKGYPLQYSGLENSMDCIVHGVAKSRTRLSDFHFHTRHMQRSGLQNRGKHLSVTSLIRKCGCRHSHILPEVSDSSSPGGLTPLQDSTSLSLNSAPLLRELQLEVC